MGDTVSASYCVCTVEHASGEDKTIAGVSGTVDPVFPHEIVCGVWNIVDRRHNRTDDDGDKDSRQNEEAAEVSDDRKCLVCKQNCAAANPGTDQIAHKDVPRLYHKLWVEDAVHADCLVPQNG